MNCEDAKETMEEEKAIQALFAHRLKALARRRLPRQGHKTVFTGQRRQPQSSQL
jgi:hypothetical protein